MSKKHKKNKASRCALEKALADLNKLETLVRAVIDRNRELEENLRLSEHLRKVQQRTAETALTIADAEVQALRKEARMRVVDQIKIDELKSGNTGKLVAIVILMISNLVIALTHLWR